MELARQKIEQSRLISANDGTPLARVTTAAGENVTAEDITTERPTVPVVPFGDAVAGQLGRLQQGHKGRHPSGPSNERNYYRQDDANRRKRQKKSNARRLRAHRDATVALETLRQQVRVAAGQTSASPAMVENARKALERKVAAVQRENPELTGEQAAEVVFRAAAGQ